MDNLLISAIVPVYNTDKKLIDRMVNSVLAQSYKNFELILVDDGSEEVCSKYLDEIKKKDARILLYHKTNGGVSSARNYGIDISNGEYLTFIDADDYVSEDFFEIALKYSLEYSADIVYGSIKFVPDGYYNELQNLSKVDFFEKDNIDIVKGCLLKSKHKEHNYIITGSPCGNMYKKKLFTEVKFIENIHYYEDQLFNLEILDIANSVLVIPYTFYYYVCNQSSAFHTLRHNKIFEVHDKYWNCLFRLSQKSNNKVKKLYRLLALDEIIIYSSRINQTNMLSKQEKKMYIIDGMKSEFIQDAIKNLSYFDSTISISKKIVLILLKAKMIVFFNAIVKIRKLPM